MRKPFFLLFLLFGYLGHSQPAKPNAAEIYQQVRKLNFLGSVLYIAAHPDDENTRLISYFANSVHARTGYLSLTRGDGGQNLIGTELRELLGVIRTQELIEARKIDGGEQMFTRANDFGYSKTPEETLLIWNRPEVLGDVVLAIRKFRPDIIINRFDHRTSGTTHGHHTASAMLSLEAMELAGDPFSYPQTLDSWPAWKTTRAFFNTSYWFYGGRDKFDKADKSKLFRLPIGEYFASLGKSNPEIAALSRSRHQSQGFGSTGTRGAEWEYLEHIKGSEPLLREDLFAGIDTSWKRVAGGAPVGDLLEKVEKEFDFTNPASSIPDLLKAYSMIAELRDSHWRDIKLSETASVIAACSGLFLEAVADAPDATPGSTINISIEAINRSPVQMVLRRAEALPVNVELASAIALSNNVAFQQAKPLQIPAAASFTQPYWLAAPYSDGMYNVANPSWVNLPKLPRELVVDFTVEIAGTPITFRREVVHKYNDDVRGEVYEPLDIVPEVSVSAIEKVHIFTGRKKSMEVRVRAGRANVAGTVIPDVPKVWKVTPESQPFTLAVRGPESVLRFEVTPPRGQSEAFVGFLAFAEGKKSGAEQIDIRYPHIVKQMVLKPAGAKVVNLDIRTGGEKIAYIMGAGDQVPLSLQQMGYEVQLVNPSEISREKLADFDVIMLGIRAYNTVRELSARQQLLLELVREGKTMIVQYNTLDEFVTKDFSPYPLKISRDRVTEENADVRFLAPSHRILNYPNKITPEDFMGWKQELGLYFPSQWDAAFTPLLSANDTGEKPKNGALLVAKYGKGHYIYTGLSFFRELPEGVPGAFRLLANLISAGK